MNQLVGPRREDRFLIRGKGEVQQRLLGGKSAFKSLQFPTSRDFKNPHDIVRRERRQPSAVRTGASGHHGSRVFEDGQRFRSRSAFGSEIPDLNRVLIRACDKSHAITGDRDAGDRRRSCFRCWCRCSGWRSCRGEGANRSSRVRIPDPHEAIRSAREQLLAVR